MNTVFKTTIRKIQSRLLYSVDYYFDMRICGQNLSECIPSLYRDDANGIGMTNTQATRYLVLKKLFSNIEISSADTLLDVGCGMGRVLAFCVREKYPCSLYGIEFNEVPYKIAKSWSEKYENVHVVNGDAFLLDYNQYSILFLGRPFLPQTFIDFIQLIESQLTHSIRFIYYVDQESGHNLIGRKGWVLKERGIIRKFFGIPIPEGPQGYSIWEYTPHQ